MDIKPLVFLEIDSILLQKHSKHPKVDNNSIFEFILNIVNNNFNHRTKLSCSVENNVKASYFKVPK